MRLSKIRDKEMVDSALLFIQHTNTFPCLVHHIPPFTISPTLYLSRFLPLIVYQRILTIIQDTAHHSTSDEWWGNWIRFLKFLYILLPSAFVSHSSHHLILLHHPSSSLCLNEFPKIYSPQITLQCHLVKETIIIITLNEIQLKKFLVKQIHKRKEKKKKGMK